MEQRLTLLTLGVSDYERAKAFYEALGWSPALEVEETAFFQGNNPASAWTTTATSFFPARSAPPRRVPSASAMAEQEQLSLQEQLEGIGAQLDWVRGYL